MKSVPAVISITSILILLGCSEIEEKPMRIDPRFEPKELNLDNKSDELGLKEKHKLKMHLKYLIEFRDKIAMTSYSDGKEIRDLNLELSKLRSLDPSINKETAEARLVKTLGLFLKEMGNAKATNNEELYETALSDLKAKSLELDSLIN